MSFTKVNAAGIGTTQPLTLSGANLSGVITASGLYVTGISTFTGNVSIGGTLTYEDTTNVDSIGLITARNGIQITGGSGLDLTGSSGIITATTYKVGAAVTISSGGLEIAGVTTTQSLKVGTAGTTLNTTSAGNVNISGKLGVGIANPIITGVTIENASVTQGLELETTNGFASGPTVRGYYRSGSSYKPLGLTGSEVVFGIQDVEKARLDSSGRFGLGTSSPTELLSIGFADNSSGKLEFRTSSYAKVAMIQGSHDSGTANGSLRFWTRNAGDEFERARIDSSGRLLVGTSSARDKFFNTTYAPQIQLEGTSYATSMISAVCNSTGEDSILILGRTRGTSIGATTVVSASDKLGRVSFQGSDGTELVEAATIFAEVDGTPGANDMPGRLVFSTTADGASSPTERMRLSANGAVRIPFVYTDTTATAANVVVFSDGYIIRSTSSKKYKTDIETIANSYSDALLECRPVWYRSTCEKDNPDWGYWGFIAEEVAEVDPRLVFWKTVETSHDENGSVIETPCDPEPEGVQYDRFVPHLLNLIKRQKEQIEAMEARLSALEAS